MSIENVNEALDIIFYNLELFEYAVIIGVANYCIEPREFMIAVGYLHSNIVMHLLDEKLNILSSITIPDGDVLQNRIMRILKYYKLDIKTIAFIKDSATKDIFEYTFTRKRIIYEIISSNTGEHSVALSFRIFGRETINKLLKLEKSYENIIALLTENRMKILTINPHPIVLIRMKKLKEIRI